MRCRSYCPSAGPRQSWEGTEGKPATGSASEEPKKHSSPEVLGDHCGYSTLKATKHMSQEINLLIHFIGVECFQHLI